MAGIAIKYVIENGFNNKMSIKELTQHVPEFNMDKVKRDQLITNQKKSEAVSNTPDTPNVLQEVKELVEEGTKKGLLYENEDIDYSNYFALELVKERLDRYDVSKVPGLQVFADIMIILCIHSAEIKTLHIYNGDITEYANN
ncbi:hypothetical protein C1645_825058 [Glomus cerebriforme]|uniref:Uncharacterized protein n=1 Tax=Glomus cerebriforme TaxID=658196 RepID=A0A397ST57_9GLOM|nr:hypothetical protein C1645_825058 [Glomus cerebriforme]